MQMEIERRAHHQFLDDRRKGKFDNQRLGQAFYNYFSLHKLSDQSKLRNLYEKDGQDAQKIIGEVFRFV